MADRPGVEVEERRAGDAAVLAPLGDVDMSGSPVLRDAVRRALSEKPGKLVVDLEKVSYMDSSGLATLVEAMKIAKGSGTNLVLCSMGERVRAIFEIARLDQYFSIVDSLDAALEI